MLSPEMKSCVERQRLGFVATVGPDGAPSISPKGSLAVWDDTTLVFVDVRSPVTVRNLIENPAVEINVVDVMARAGWRFRGRARVLLSGPTFERVRAFYAARGLLRPFEHVVFVGIERVAALRSPAYDDGAPEDEVRGAWSTYWAAPVADASPPAAL